MKVYRPLKAIRLFCLDCVGGSPREVAKCTGNRGEPPCWVWPYRFGKDVRRRVSEAERLRLAGMGQRFKPRGHAIELPVDAVGRAIDAPEVSEDQDD